MTFSLENWTQANLLASLCSSAVPRALLCINNYGINLIDMILSHMGRFSFLRTINREFSSSLWGSSVQQRQCLEFFTFSLNNSHLYWCQIFLACFITWKTFSSSGICSWRKLDLCLVGWHLRCVNMCDVCFHLPNIEWLWIFKTTICISY